MFSYDIVLRGQEASLPVEMISTPEELEQKLAMWADKNVEFATFEFKGKIAIVKLSEIVAFLHVPAA